MTLQIINEIKRNIRWANDLDFLPRLFLVFIILFPIMFVFLVLK